MSSCVDCSQNAEKGRYCNRCRDYFQFEKFQEETIEKIAVLWRMAAKQSNGLCDKKAQKRAVRLLARIGAFMVLRRIMNTEIKTVAGASHEDTWGTLHSGGFNYIGIHPETKKLAREILDKI